jgi:hypothetical protein
MDIDTFSSTIAQIYDASLRVERWDDVLENLTTQFNSRYGQMSYFSSFQDANPFMRFSGFDPVQLELLLPRYRELSPTDPRLPPRQFKVYHCRQLVSDDRLWSTPMYQQVLAPISVEYAMYFAANLSDDENCAVMVMRGPEGSPYTDEDCEDFGRFVPHICRAVTLHGTLRRARAVSAAVQALIDSVPMGMIIARDETIILANAAARALFAQGDPLRSMFGRLQASAPQGQARLGRAIREAKSKPGSPIGVTLVAEDAAQVRVIVRSLEPPTAAMLDAHLTRSRCISRTPAARSKPGKRCSGACSG